MASAPYQAAACCTGKLSPDQALWHACAEMISKIKCMRFPAEAAFGTRCCAMDVSAALAALAHAASKRAAQMFQRHKPSNDVGSWLQAGAYRDNVRGSRSVVESGV